MTLPLKWFFVAVLAVAVSDRGQVSWAVDEAAKTTKAAVGDGVFELTNVWDIHLTLTAKEYEGMQAATGGGFPGFGPPQPPAAPRADGRELHRNRFGVDLPWATCSVKVGDETFDNVAIRYKGNGTFMDASRTIKKSIKVDLDRLGETKTFRGIKTFNIHCGVTDPTKCRESLSYRLYRAAGVPAPKTALAEVRLTVPGKFENELLGVYTLIEDINKPFLRETFGTDKGLLMKPEGVRDIEYRGEEWERYLGAFIPKRDAKPGEARRVIDLARLIHQGDDEHFRSEIESFLDIDAYLRFLAVTGFIVNPDSFFVGGHNYYLYLHPETKKFHFIPWDVDRAIANFPIFGSADQQMDLSIVHPYSGSHKLTERLLAIPVMNEKYQSLLRELAGGVFSKENLLNEVSVLNEATRELLARDTQAAAARKETSGGGFGLPMMNMKPPSLVTFVEKRAASIEAQLQGRSKGHIPAGFGPGNFKPGDMLAQPVLDKLDADKNEKLSKDEWLVAAIKLLADSDLDLKGWADEKSLAKTLNAMFPQPPAGPGPGGGPSGAGAAPPAGPPREGPRPGGPGGPPGGPPAGGFNPDMFRPGTMLAGAIVRRADADKNGQLSKDELVGTAEKLFDAQDSSKSGQIDKAKVGEMFNQLAPPPPAFGPPGGGMPPPNRPR